MTDQHKEPVEVCPGVFQIPAQRPSCHVYLIVGTSKIIMIDSGIDSSFGDLRDGLGGIGFTPTDVDLVVNTHEHFDPSAATSTSSAPPFSLLDDSPLQK